MPHPDVLDEPLLPPEGVATMLTLISGNKPNVAAVYELTRTRARDPLPALRVGKYLRFRRSEVLAWLERQRVRRS